MMSRADAEIFYDGRIPPGAVDDTLPSRFAPSRQPVRLGRVTEKPESVRRRMAAAFATLANTGCVAEHDLKAFGFTTAQIAAHKDEALRQMLVEHPTLLSIEWAA